MIELIFTNVNYLINQQILIALIASFFWGIISVLISPCHLSGIPLICGYLIKRCDNIKNAFMLSSIFSIGVLVSIAVIGVITITLGRIFGDVGFLGNLVVGALFIIFGAYLLGFININWEGFQYKSTKISSFTVFVMGFVFGIGLGPCTFAYIAPVIGFTFTLSFSETLRPVLLLLFFAIGHTIIIAFAGVSGSLVVKILNFNNKSNLLIIFQKIVGAVLLVIGLLYIWI